MSHIAIKSSLVFTALICSHCFPAAAQGKLTAGVSPLETQVMGAAAWVTHSQAGLRVIVKNHMTGKPIQAAVHITVAEFRDDGSFGKPMSLLSRMTNSFGTIDTGFRVPAVKAGSYRLMVDVVSPYGKDHVEQNLELVDYRKILLTTDKPAYQPGQTIHIRALAIDQATQLPVNGESITIEIKDGRDNKVFKSRPLLSKFGVASADFVLADEVNEGPFTVTALMPSGQTDKSVRVEHYILPKYKVSIETDQPYYLPGDTIHGTVEAHYFYGKPVTKAQAEINIDAPDAASTTATLTGSTGEDGKWKFEYKVPEQFGGDRFVDGKSVLSVNVKVTDLVSHIEQQDSTVPVVAQPVLLTMIPEHHRIVTGVPNRIFIAATKPDGSPVSNAKIAVDVLKDYDDIVIATTKVNTDAFGIAAFEFEPDAIGYHIEASYTDERGVIERKRTDLHLAREGYGLVLQTDSTFAKVGDTIRLTAVTESENDTVYFDVVRDRQTLFTRSVAPQFGTAAISIPLSNDMSGTLQAHAYIVAADGRVVEDTRTIIVSPARDLKIALTANRGSYKPGEDALVHVSVKDATNNSSIAAIGISIVDESIFSLTQPHPGYEPAFFTLAEELLTPQFQINNLSPVGIYDKTDISAASRQRAGAMLLSAASQKPEFDYHVNTFNVRWIKSKSIYLDDMKRRYMTIAAALREYARSSNANISDPDLMSKLRKDHLIWREDLIDPWGTPYKLAGASDHPSMQRFDYSSAGPDGTWNTSDDLTVGAPPYYPPNPGGRAGFGGGGFGGGIGGAGGFGGGGIGGGGGEADTSTSMSTTAPPSADVTPAAAPIDKTQQTPVMTRSDDAPIVSAQPQPRIREFFPETLFWEPQIITDSSGSADFRVPIADSITTWRLSAMANDRNGLLGSATSSIKAFQDFFIDVDLPLSLTKDDAFTVPVTVHNYMDQDQDVAVTLAADPWFASTEPLTQRIHIAAGDISLVKFPIVAKQFGSHTFKVTAIGTKLSDAVKKSITVLPNGLEQRLTIGDTLEGKTERTIDIPDGAIDKTNRLWVKIFPGVLSQLMDGLDGLLSMPGGCFEQTSSSTYPDVLILNYLGNTHKASPDIRKRAESYINTGYQTLATFECKSGGFSWFGNEPAHQVLTAYGLLEFSDMAKVHDVDPALISRTQSWLAGKQNADGSWLETNQGIAEGIINRQSDRLRTTAYIAWALAESGYEGPALVKAEAYIRQHADEASDSYSLALILAFLTAHNINGGNIADSVAQKLTALAKTTARTAYWNDAGETFTGAQSVGADAETTGLAAYSLVRYHLASNVATKALTYLNQTRSSNGGWSSTQSTVWSLKALLAAGTSKNTISTGSISIAVNGKPFKTVEINASNDDTLHEIDVTPSAHIGHNTITLQYQGSASANYQIVGQYYLPWTNVAAAKTLTPESMSLKVVYDKTVIAPSDTVTAAVTARNITGASIPMPLFDIGTPPGFDIERDTLDAAVKTGEIGKYTVNDGHLIIYMESLKTDGALSLKYRMHPRSVMKALTPVSRAYPYYNPGALSTLGPQLLEVKEVE